MKSKYCSPSVEEIKLELSSIVAASPKMGPSESSVSASDVGTGKSYIFASKGQSFGSGLWSDMKDDNNSN